jgi:hypothetical protein
MTQIILRDVMLDWNFELACYWCSTNCVCAIIMSYTASTTTCMSIVIHISTRTTVALLPMAEASPIESVESGIQWPMSVFISHEMISCSNLLCKSSIVLICHHLKQKHDHCIQTRCSRTLIQPSLR